MSNKIILYVPSITKEGLKVNHKQAVNNSLMFFAEQFGGATSYKANGSWKLSNGKLQVEAVTIIYSNVDKLSSKQKTNFITYASKLKKDLNQDSVMIETDNKVQFV